MTRQRIPTHNPGWMQLLGAIVHRVPLLPGALCAGRGHLFDADDGPSGKRTAEAISLCRRCPALPSCQTWVESLPRHRVPRGVLAGRYRRPTSQFAWKA